MQFIVVTKEVLGVDGCNETRGWLPCFDASCYQVEQHCDGVFQCQDGADEMGCTYSDVTRCPTKQLFHLFEH